MTERSYVYEDRFGVRRTMIYDDAKPDSFTVRTQQRLDEVVDNNRELRGDYKPGKHSRLLARGVPMTVYEQSVREQWDDRDWAKWLNDPDNAAFRIYAGRVA